MEYLNIAIAKGRLVDHTIDILHAIGINFPDYHEKSRKLIFEDPVKKFASFS